MDSYQDDNCSRMNSIQDDSTQDDYCSRTVAVERIFFLNCPLFSLSDTKKTPALSLEC